MTLRRVAVRAGRRAHDLAHAGILAAAFVFSATLGSASLAQTTGTAVEYYHAGFDHFFVTANVGEIADIDGGKYGTAWARTGYTFLVWTSPGAGTSETCRFFSSSYAPKSSHFYTPVAAECELRKGDPAWTYESVAFHLRTSPAGTCPTGEAALYRLFNQGRGDAPNHRFTTSRAAAELMRAQGWLQEGNGPDTVFACVPATGVAVPGSGWWTGTTSAGEQLVGAMFDDGSFVFFYDSASRTGVVDGTATFAGNAFVAPLAHDIVIDPTPAEYPAEVLGSVVVQSSMSGTITSGGRTRTFSATYGGATGAPVSLAQVAGTFDGVSSTGVGKIDMVVSVSAAGALSGAAGTCTVTGSLLPRASSALMDATVVHGGAGCALGQAATSGIAVYVSDLRGLLIVTRSADLRQVFAFGGTK